MISNPSDFHFEEHGTGRVALVILDPAPLGMLSPHVYSKRCTDGRHAACFELDKAWSQIVEDRICDALDGLATA